MKRACAAKKDHDFSVIRKGEVMRSNSHTPDGDVIAEVRRGNTTTEARLNKVPDQARRDRDREGRELADPFAQPRGDDGRFESRSLINPVV
jgi:hypothetical protein